MKKLPLAIFSSVLMLLSVTAASAQQTLTANTNDGNAPWVVTGEPSMIINGFDLNSLGITLPATITSISIAVNTPVAGTPIEMVVYQDANGGSPSDATLAGRTTVDITQSGTFTGVFTTPVAITQPAVWVGFYLPVNFNFFADTSGTSVLTYWAWTPGGRFDVASLGSAGVLGPSNGTSPVNINLNGKARITAQITSANGTTTAVSTPLTSAETAAGTSSNLGVLAAFPSCTDALYDTADERVSWREQIDVLCNTVPAWQSPAAPNGYLRQGTLYDIYIFKENGVIAGDRLDIAVTHCIRPDAQYLPNAVIGVAYGAPRQWRILPSQRFNDLVCAEVRHGGNLSYFVPIGGTLLPTATPSA